MNNSAVRWVMLSAILIALLAGIYFVVGTGWRSPPRSAAPVDPTRPVIEVQLPLVEISAERSRAFVIENEIVIPPRALVHLKGKFRTGSRKGGSLVTAETKTPKNALTGSFVASVQFVDNSECEFDVIIFNADKPVSGSLEVRLGKEFLAVGRIKASP